MTVRTGISPHGQGHETSLAQIAAGVLAVPMDAVTVLHSDTARSNGARGPGGRARCRSRGRTSRCARTTWSSRDVTLAADELEADAADLEGPVDGGFRVAGAPDRAVTWSVLAGVAARSGTPLAAAATTRDPGTTFPFGTHVAVVEVDTETGDVRLVRLVAVDDCGRVLNPALVRGQQHGGMAQGIAQALFEEVRYDADGQPDHRHARRPTRCRAPPNCPDLETWSTETPTPREPPRREGDRRGRLDRIDPGDPERGRRRARAPGRAPRRPAVHARAGLARDPRRRDGSTPACNVRRMTDMPVWERRYRAPKLTLPLWSRVAPDRAVYETNESGIWQVHALDVDDRRRRARCPTTRSASPWATPRATAPRWSSGRRTPVTRPVDGSPSRGRAGAPSRSSTASRRGGTRGWRRARASIAAGISDRDGFAVYASTDGGPVRELARSDQWLTIWGAYGVPGPDVAALSADGTLLATQHAEHGDLTHPSLRVIDPRSGAVVGERGDGSSAVDRRRVVAGRGRPATDGGCGAGRPHHVGDLGPGHRRLDRARARALRRRAGARLVAGRRCAAPAAPARRPARAVALRPGDGHDHPRADAAGRDRRRPGPPRRVGLVHPRRR